MQPDGLVSVSVNFQQWVPLLAVLGALVAPTLAQLVGITLTARNATRTAKAAMVAAAKAELAADQVATTLVETNQLTTGKLDQIHILVNSRLSEALKKIDRLEARLYATTGEEPTGEPPPRT